MLQARLDLYMLGQCLFEDAMLLICSQLTTLLSSDSRVPFLGVACAHCSIDRAGVGETQ
jgi:hypothetical protein